MKYQGKIFERPSGPLTIWSKGASELIPERFRRIVTVVMPLLYLLFTLFGFTAAFFPVPTFALIVGYGYGQIWAGLIGLTSLLSLVTLIFRNRIEIYSAISLAVILFIYPFYVGYLVLHDISASGDNSRLAVIWAVATYSVMPAWRSLDIALEIRKSRQRQLYVKATLGEGP